MFSNTYQNYDIDEEMNFFNKNEQINLYQPEPAQDFFSSGALNFRENDTPILPNIFEEISPMRIRENFRDEDLIAATGGYECLKCKSKECSCNKCEIQSNLDFSFSKSIKIQAPLEKFDAPAIDIKQQNQDGLQDQSTVVKQTLETDTCKESEDDKETSKQMPVVKPQKKSKSRNDSNLFLVRRACFRGFSEYFKNKFAATNYSWQRKRGNKKKKTPMTSLIKEFAEQEFGSIVKRLSDEEWIKFRTELITVMFSHRYKKNDDFLQGINFSKIRNVLYHYTTESRNEFMSNSYFCFFIHHFYVKNGKEFLETKIQEKSKLNYSLLKMELNILDQEAMAHLSKSFPF
ncbi:unnamed protein product [Moneuplotes crassus]|uniref:Uncharacterized protein n=1 Tax=Euplotes crassus TaxID=5936 RepID=A0AAD1XDS3_EUPCR|nr:unnamed protein product [Moneuplotes crassus]